LPGFGVGHCKILVGQGFAVDPGQVGIGLRVGQRESGLRGAFLRPLRQPLSLDAYAADVFFATSGWF
jgi:hypothetical protein